MFSIFGIGGGPLHIDSGSPLSSFLSRTHAIFEQPEQSEQREQSEQSEQREQREQSEQSEQREQPEQSEQSEQSEQPEQPEQREQPEQFQQPWLLSCKRLPGCAAANCGETPFSDLSARARNDG